MKIQEELYLMWIPNSWSVFTYSTCPDPVALPDYFYKKYEFPSQYFDDVFDKLIEKKTDLVKKEIIPTKENYDDIFPDISDILE